MKHFKANIAIIPKATTFEKAFGIFIVALMFIPFAIGIMTGYVWALLSLPAGIVIMFLFNLTTKGKFNTENWTQKD